jgi:hypothetical protein
MASVRARGRPAPAVVTAAVAVFIPVADAAFNGLTLGLLGGGAACFVLAALLLSRVPERVTGDLAAGRAVRAQGGKAGPLPAGPTSANVEP